MSEPVLIARDVVAGYVPGMPICHGVSIDVRPGEIVTIIGPNGAGKSTFLKALAGLVLFESGTVHCLGQDVSGRPSHELIQLGLGFVPQTGNVFTGLTIHENLVMGGHTLSAAELKTRLARTYEQFPLLAERRSATGGVLSGGQRQTLAVARALMTDPRVIMLDEPTAGLSPRVVGEVFASLRGLAQEGVAVLMVEQNAKAALRISDRGYVLAEGRNRMAASAADLLVDPAVGEAFLGGKRHAR
ncbi:ABC transporter ATP-binding protein [Microvirga antarctica]|uniref:ABC transporter ATP-binding protein n=1 Tax=Microvirga antarctica TaxID=2819233 RepID=UPI001B30916D|nr:ABC transporter ATP-binding protein [Microvirga antarctica]